MKKFYSLLIVAFITTSFASATGCVIDSSNHAFLSPNADSIPCVERGVAYNTSVQLVVPDSIDLFYYGAPGHFILYVDSVILTGVNGLPTGISAFINPAPGTFFPAQYACVQLNGTTTDAAGHFNLSLVGNITAHGTPYPPFFDGDTTVDLATLQQMALGQLDLSVDVIEQGAACRSLWPAQACIIDTANTNFFSPLPDSIPCIERGVAFNQIIQIHVPQTFDIGPFIGFPAGIIILNVDSMQIDSITNFPSGLLYALNPANGFFLGGTNGCANVTGTTNAPTGNYPLGIYGTISVSGIPSGFGFPSDTTFDLHTAQGYSTMFNLAVDVINPGDACRATSSVKSFSADLNSLLRVYPNPSNGVFNFNLNAGRRINGEINVVDVTGRKVFSQLIDASGLYTTTIDLSKNAKGLYTLQLKTAEGFASKNISID